MNNSKNKVAYGVALGCTLLAGQVVADDKLPVVATFSILGDMVAQVGGEHVEVTTLVDANGDAHVFSPRPLDARAVKNAKLLVMNGLGFEGWITRLTDSAEFSGKTVVATDGIELLRMGEGVHDEHDEHDDVHAQNDGHGHHDDEHHGDEHAHHADEHHEDEHAHHSDEHHEDEHAHHADEHDDHHEGHGQHADAHGHHHGEFDPHAWHDLDNAQIFVSNITQALIELDPDNAASYRQNASDYTQKLEQLDLEIRQSLASIPAEQRRMVIPHDSLGYLGQAYGITILSPQGASTESEASAAEVAAIIRYIRQENIRAVFVENVADSRLIEQISRETDATIGGTLYTDALSGANEPAATYLQMMHHNASTIIQALK